MNNDQKNTLVLYKLNDLKMNINNTTNLLIKVSDKNDLNDKNKKSKLTPYSLNQKREFHSSCI